MHSPQAFLAQTVSWKLLSKSCFLKQKKLCQAAPVRATMKNKIAGAYLNLLIGKDLDIHRTGNQSGNITVHARGWHSPSWIFNEELGSPWVVSDRKSLQVDTVVAARHCLALGTAGARHLEPAASEAARQSTEQPGSLMAMTSPQRLTQAEAIFFFSKPFISRQCSGANWTWLCAKSELRLNQFRQR